MKKLVHQQSYKEILWNLGLESISIWGLLFLLDFVFVIATLKIFLPDKTLNPICYHQNQD